MKYEEKTKHSKDERLKDIFLAWLHFMENEDLSLLLDTEQSICHTSIQSELKNTYTCKD